MSKRLSRIAPWQAAKVCAVLYFIVGLIMAVVLGLAESLIPIEAEGESIGLGLIIAFPILYGLGALIFVPIGCWLYNFSARLVGGLEVEIETRDG